MLKKVHRIIYNIITDKNRQLWWNHWKENFFKKELI